MQLDYAHPATPIVRTGVVAATGVLAVGAAGLLGWCCLHAIHVVYAAQHSPGPFFCAQAADEWRATLGLPLDRTLSLGMLSFGVGFVSMVQSVRCFNAGRPRRTPGAA